MFRFLLRSTCLLLCTGLLTLALNRATAADAPQLKLAKGNKIVLIGNTLAERQQHFGHFETLLHSRFPELNLVVRNLGWSADELTLRPRSKDFNDHGHKLTDHKPDVILAFFGFNESFGGEKGLEKFKGDLQNFIQETTTTKYNGLSAPQLVLFSPIAHENLGKRELPDGAASNRNLAMYTAAMKDVAAKAGVVFVDLFDPTQELMGNSKIKLTINGIHVNEYGDEQVAKIMDKSLFGDRPAKEADLAKLRAEVNEKALQFWYDHRAVNGFYIYGGRKAPFGVVNFPAEFAKLRKMIAKRDERIWAVAQGKSVPEKIDDSETGEFTKIETNFKGVINISPPEESIKKFTVPEGYEVNLFASEVEFPELENPVQFTFDNKGRLWVATMSSYPQYLPGTPVNDKILILEDTDGDGKADKKIIFADKLHIPTGLEVADGGVYVAQQPNLMFLKDTNGDDVADERTIVLHGFDSADSHHSISDFTIDQGGALYFSEGTFHHSQVESPYGPVRVKDAGYFRFEPRTNRLSVFISYGFANPWGHYIDRWGQNLIADASGGANYFGAAFSGDVDYPNKHASMKQFLTKQWRPTAGCELVSSRNFPDEAQGNYLLNNCIGFQGTLQYKMKDEGAGFHADPVEPLLQSSEQAFRPVDLEFAPDGSLYICDWFNPLVGHMQHNLRDPNRDHAHGRIWRVRYTKKPLVKPAKIAGEPIPQLLSLLNTEPEERTRYRVRTELATRDTKDVLAETEKWLAALDKKDADYEHQVLEALWIHQRQDVVNEKLLKQVLRSPDFRARAGATRVLCYWKDRVADPIALLQVQVNDEHPRVRLEAVRALSFFNSQQAIDTAVESLIYEQDDYLKYTFNETMKTLERRVKGSTALPHVPTEREKKNAESDKKGKKK
ncbi:Membrane bound L-sorbosone dehydrogenase [Anatilimnocola aggregata]|uniref:Membrane bound L-sorbosone dehydrogenase n=1 Tax=Anatilimnocola aggregata TaxID=2528021 RepID=A0A517YKS8_9BACT|nr:PVC-type heme-binding CxxCH protein [Anatilimnocola aggregata]QDU30823.1 Membrane bound L-sorbosone dehydrogenase [Anatilimnocola aggregata]